MNQTTLYDRDSLLWVEQQTDCLKTGRWAELDIDHLVEELSTLGRSEQQEIGSYLQLLFMHLLKWQYQPERRNQSWKNTISNCRDKIQDCLEDTPSLQRLLEEPDWVQKYYRRARRDAAKEMEQSIEMFSAECSFTIEQIANSNFYPAL